MHRQTADKFRDKAVAQQILRLDVAQDGLGVECRFRGVRLAIAGEAQHVLADATLHHLVEIDERSATNKQHVGGVELDVFLLRMLAATLRRDVADGALENLEQCLLHAFAGHVTGDGDVLGTAGDFVDFVDVNDPDLRALHVVICRLQ